MYRRYLFIGGKVAATVGLLAVIFAWTLIVFVIIPFVVIMGMNKKKKNLSGFSLAIAMTPVAVIWTLLMRLWSRDKYNEAERKFLQGFKDGHLQAHYEEGKRQGYTSVATEESLKPVSIYDIRWRK